MWSTTVLQTAPTVARRYLALAEVGPLFTCPSAACVDRFPSGVKSAYVYPVALLRCTLLTTNVGFLDAWAVPRNARRLLGHQPQRSLAQASQQATAPAPAKAPGPAAATGPSERGAQPRVVAGVVFEVELQMQPKQHSWATNRVETELQHHIATQKVPDSFSIPLPVVVCGHCEARGGQGAWGQAIGLPLVTGCSVTTRQYIPHLCRLVLVLCLAR